MLSDMHMPSTGNSYAYVFDITTFHEPIWLGRHEPHSAQGWVSVTKTNGLTCQCNKVSCMDMGKLP